jgi:hypothetical protein
MGIWRYGSRYSKPHPYREVVSFLIRSLSCGHILLKNLEETSRFLDMAVERNIKTLVTGTETQSSNPQTDRFRNQQPEQA